MVGLAETAPFLLSWAARSECVISGGPMIFGPIISCGYLSRAPSRPHDSTNRRENSGTISRTPLSPCLSWPLTRRAFWRSRRPAVHPRPCRGLPSRPSRTGLKAFRQRPSPASWHRNIGLPVEFTLDACRHGGMTELEEAELTDGQGRALSAHRTKESYAGYAKRTAPRILSATRKRHAHWLANQAATSIQNGQENAIQNEKLENERSA